MTTKNILAFDIGAESGRAIVGKFDGRRIGLEELHRFPNTPVRMLGTLYWDLPRLWQDVLTGLQIATATHGAPTAVGVDTWGVDYGFLGADGHPLRFPVSYRDARTEGMLERGFSLMPKEEIYRRTGLQFLRLNTLFQLLSERERRGAEAFAGVSKMLFTPDMLNYLLTGVMGAEYTIASSSQMLDARAKSWDVEMLAAFGIPGEILPPMVQTGATLGPLLKGVASETGAKNTVCVATAGHDTASAVAAAPASNSSGDWCYISSGTWSLMGAEIPEPELGADALAANFTNEGGVAGTIRFLKNIMGLWLVQQCRKSFGRAGQSFDYAQLADHAHAAPAFGPLVDPDDDGFLNPPDMAAAIRDYCKRTGQTPPETPGQIVRCCLESLACRYRWTLERMEKILGRGFASIHIVGGGSQNRLLCHMTADICRRPVVAGPTEATALGNLLVQLMGLGELKSLSDVRAVVRASSETAFYDPKPDDRWEASYAKFVSLVGG